ncbi:MAG TPA: hypothetical protein DCQ30_01225 [Acidimicrobiaceae bacterium]|nr:hypothetical protein [Acidimicrobiaceae bacterium]
MSSTLLERPVVATGPGGGLAARRAVGRWAWRLFVREWRQQLLVLALIVVAVAATVVGAAAAANAPAPVDGTFGTAQDLASFQGGDPHLSAGIAALEHRFGAVDVIENETLAVPGTVSTYFLRAQDPRGPYGRPMLSLLSGHYPAGAGQVALTPALASELHLHIGDLWRQGPMTRRVVGLVENPQSLLDEFALVPPGQVPAPNTVTVLFDGQPVPARAIGSNVQGRAPANTNAFNPETISLAGLTVGMILIALVAVGGFTVLAQRRLRSLGMLASLGATDKNVSFVVRANGVVVGVAGALLGTAVGILLWFAYRPRLESSSHHVIGLWALPWLVVVLAMVLAVLSTYFAASRPARAVTRIPVVTALSGRPAPPRKVHRSAVPGIVCMVIAFFFLSWAGSQAHTGGGMKEVVLGLVALLPGVILLAPFCLSALAWLGRRAPVAVRLALRDLARYRARSGSALAAISIGVLIAVIIVIVASVRYANALDYAGPNLASNQLILYTPTGPGYTPPCPPGVCPKAPTGDQVQAMGTKAHAVASALGAQHVVELESMSASLSRNAPGRNWNGSIYVATPALLHAFGIRASAVSPAADILSMRPGLATLSNMHLDWCNQFAAPQNVDGKIFQNPCTTGGTSTPVIQQVGSLPSGVSAPNTVITEQAVQKLGLESQLQVAGWLIETAHPLTASQISNARLAASSAGMTLETKNDQPTSAQVVNWATVFGIALALAILAMSVGLIRAETAGDLRTLAATGAGSRTRRTLTAATAGGLGFLGALLGTVAGYVGVIGFLRSNSLEGGISALGNVPVRNLLLILVGTPLAATAVGWLLAGREPAVMAHQPIE